MAPARPMGFPEAVATVLWLDWLRFDRRGSRSEYWFGFLGCCLLAAAWFIALGAILPGGAAALPDAGWTLRHPLAGLLNLVFAVWLHVGMLAAGVRRLHDAGRSGLWLHLAWPPYIGLLALDWLGRPLLTLPLLLWWLAGSLVLLGMLAAAPSPHGNRWGPAWRPGPHGRGDADFGTPPDEAPAPPRQEPTRLFDPPLERIRPSAPRGAGPHPRRRPPPNPARARAAENGGLEREIRAARTRNFRSALAAGGGLAVVAVLCVLAYGLGLRLGGELPLDEGDRPASADPVRLIADAEAAAAADDWAGAMELFGQAAALGSARGAEGEKLARDVLAWHRGIRDALGNGPPSASAETVENGMAAAALSPAAAEDLRTLRRTLGREAWRELAGPEL